MQFRAWQAIAVGVIGGLVLAVIARFLGMTLDPAIAISGEVTWMSHAIRWANFVATIAPGLIAGYLLGRRGLLVGAIAGFIVDFGRSAMFGVNWEPPVPVLALLLILSEGALMPCVLGALAGGTGELLKRRAAT